MQTSARQSVLRVVAGGLHWTGVLRLMQRMSESFEISFSNNHRKLRRARGPKFAILCYHRVGTGGVPYYSALDPRVFEAQMALLSRVYRVVTLDQLCQELAEAGSETTSSRQAVAITFDDGYRDLYTYALPVLRKFSLPATVYLTASAIETGEAPWYDRIFAQVMASRSETLEFEGAAPGRFQLSSPASRLHAASEVIRALRQNYSNQERVAACAVLESKMDVPAEILKNRMLSWEHVREMQTAGFAFEGHTMNHPVVSRLAACELEHELADSKRLLEEKLQKPVTHFAYPFGSLADLSSETCSLIPRYGYCSAASTIWGINTPATSPYLLRRIGAEEFTVPQLDFYLRWLFLSDRRTPAELLSLEQAAESQTAAQREVSRDRVNCEVGGGNA